MFAVRFRSFMMLAIVGAVSFCATKPVVAQAPVVPLTTQYYCSWRLDCVDENENVITTYSGNGDLADDCLTAQDNAWRAAELCADGMSPGEGLPPCEGCNGYRSRIYLSACKPVSTIVRTSSAPPALWVVEYTVRTRGGNRELTISVEGVSYCDTKQQIERFICRNLQKPPYCGVCRPLGVRILQRPCCCQCCKPAVR